MAFVHPRERRERAERAEGLERVRDVPGPLLRGERGGWGRGMMTTDGFFFFFFFVVVDGF